jgi:hypothetical protein
VCKVWKAGGGGCHSMPLLGSFTNPEPLTLDPFGYIVAFGSAAGSWAWPQLAPQGPTDMARPQAAGMMCW